MPAVKHLGYNVALIHDLPWAYSYGDGTFYKLNDCGDEKVINFINELKYRYLVAFTANLFQEGARKILRDNGFKEYIEFLSSHNEYNETITMWVKLNDRFEDLSQNEISLAYANCSINCCMSYASKFRFTIMANDKITKENKDQFKGFVKVKNFPIRYKLDKQYIVKSKKK